MKKNLYLVGAGDLGREMESWLTLFPDFYGEWEIRGYLDQNPHALNGYPTDFKVIGNPLEFQYMPDDHVVMCVTNTVSKLNLVTKLKGKVQFFTYIAPNAILGKFTSIGEGVIVCPNVCIMTNTRIDEFVFINAGTQIGHDCIVGAYSSLMAHVNLGGPVILGERVYMGTNSTIIPRINVGDDVKIGTGSIVIRNLKRAGTYFGNPASLVEF